VKLPGLQYHSPHTFSRKQRLLLFLGPILAAWIYKLLSATCRAERWYEERLQQVFDEHGHAIFALYHETTGLMLWMHRGRNYHSTASYSYDGELAARMVARFGNETVRGSSSAGGSMALGEMEKALKQVPVVGLTVDGPRGPRHEVKPGVAVLAARSGIPIVPVSCAIDACWRLRSWDRFTIPKPFSRLVCAYGHPIPPPPDTSRESVEAARQAVETQLKALHNELHAALGIPAA